MVKTEDAGGEDILAAWWRAALCGHTPSEQGLGDGPCKKERPEEVMERRGHRGFQGRGKLEVLIAILCRYVKVGLTSHGPD